ncbi:MAG: hypothetical protein WCA20_10485, partial [Candidatus Sulfotelmatobacter sp.]
MTCPVPAPTLASARIRSVASPTTLPQNILPSTQPIAVVYVLCEAVNHSRKRPAATGCEQFSLMSVLTVRGCKYCGILPISLGSVQTNSHSAANELLHLPYGQDSNQLHRKH